LTGFSKNKGYNNILSVYGSELNGKQVADHKVVSFYGLDYYIVCSDLYQRADYVQKRAGGTDQKLNPHSAADEGRQQPR
jgi:hypothetical protein